MARAFTDHTEYTPLGHYALAITAVGSLTAEQVAAITAPFDLTTKPKVVASLGAFSVTCDLSGVDLEDAAYVLEAWVWVKGTAGKFAPRSYHPTPPKGLKVGLWRLSPLETGATAQNADTVSVTLPGTLPVVRVEAIVRGLFNPFAQLPPP